MSSSHIETTPEALLFLNKKEIKSVVKKFKYYYPDLQENRKAIIELSEDPTNIKGLRRYFKEKLVALRLLCMHLYIGLPKVHGDILKNPMGLPTQQEARLKIVNNKEGSILGPFYLVHIPEEEFDNYLNAYKELIYKK